MSEENDSISVKKGDIWKYSTFVLIALVIVGGFFVLSNNSPTNNAVNTGNAGATAGAASDLSIITENPSLFPSLGPENAKHVVLEFSDFQCPYCGMASGLPSWTSQYVSQYGDLIGSAGKVQEMAEKGEVRFIYVSMSFLGQESVYAAQAGLCANKQGKFWEMHDEIFKASTGPQENDGRYSKENLKNIAKKVSGLDTGKFNSCLDNDETLSDVQQAASIAGQFASGTPTFYVDGRQVSASWTQLSSLLN
ncbi:MAG: thioredoxin domain-containing protein [Nanoarchaeota archaeon]|nr:thioredoxin domain-containing protein [Nanoarchaeota archaeon]